MPAICSTSGWVETFDATTRQPLVEYDSRWTKLAGQLDVDPDLGAAVGTEATDDGGDDYAFRGVDTPTGSVEIEIDFYWGGNGAVGAEGAVQLTTPHRLYEAALWRGTLDLIYAYGPTPWDYESIANTPVTAPPGNYRIVFRTVLNGGRWELTARLLDGAKQYAVIGEVGIADSRLGPGGQGIGIWADGSPTSYVTEMRVTPLD